MTLNSANLIETAEIRQIRKDHAERVALLDTLCAAAAAADRARSTYVFAEDDKRAEALDKSLLASEALHQARRALLDAWGRK